MRGLQRLAVSVGVCAYNEESRLPACLASLLSQRLPPEVEICEVLVVASGCTDRTEKIVEAWSHRDERIVLLRERQRNGKATAINLILSHARGDILVLQNGDAVLRPGALASLIRPFLDDPRVSIACGAPVLPPGSRGLSSHVAESLWVIHNRTLEILSNMGRPNHCCDELLAVRRGFISSLPAPLVNDGAYLGVEASLRGVSVRFCSEALVEVEIPTTLRGVIAQRHRILRGHRQVKQILGQAPNTFETLLLNEPDLALRIVAGILRRPRALLTLFFLLFPLEVIAAGLSALDRMRRLEYDPAWTPVE